MRSKAPHPENLKNVRIRWKEEGIPERVVVIVIDRPAALNALNIETLRELRAALEWTQTEDEVACVVLTGGGEKAFIAGADISEMKDLTPTAAVQFSQTGQEVTKLLELMSKPTIAAVHGFALGGGTEMAISCDFICASEKAVFGQPEVGLGVIPGFGGTIRLAKFVGFPRAKELIFSGRRVMADEALRIGLVNQVFPVEGFLTKVLEMASQLTKNSGAAIGRAKALLNEFSESTGLGAKLDAEAHAFGMLFESSDQREGMTAFVEKRKPQFR
jgi:enoyl-CoA hydratase